jgi:hypothetical protein
VRCGGREGLDLGVAQSLWIVLRLKFQTSTFVEQIEPLGLWPEAAASKTIHLLLPINSPRFRLSTSERSSKPLPILVTFHQEVHEVFFAT